MSASLGLGTEKVCMIERGGGSIKVPVEKILSHSTKIVVGEFYCRNNSAYRKILCFTVMGQEFPSIVFCLTVLSNSAGGILECFIKFGYRKSLYN